MDPFTIVVIIVVVLFFVAVIGGMYLASGWNTVSKEAISSFGVQPNFICPSDSCKVDVDYTVETTHDNTKVSLKVEGPKGTVTELSTALTFSKTTNGADTAFWMDDIGDYIFTLHVAGDQIGDTIRTCKSTLFPHSGGAIKHSARVDMARADDLQVARDSFNITEHPSGKTNDQTICDKSARIIGVRYLSGGLPTHQNDLDITIRKPNGDPIWDFTGAKPGDSVPVTPPIVIAGGVRVDGTMASGFSGQPPNTQPNPFSPSDIVPWDIEIDVECI